MASGLEPTPALRAAYDRLATDAGVVDVSRWGLLEITGKDRASFLHSFCTNDVKGLTPGSGCEAFITSVQGKTLGHAFIFAEAERLLLSTAPDQAAVLSAHLDKYLISEDVAFRDLSSDYGQLLAVGPGTRDGVPTAVAPWFPWNGLATMPAYWALVSRDQLPLTIETLAAGGLALCGEEAWQMLRIEQRFPEFGSDFGSDNLPQELGRDAQAISFTKGCYLGQETVARIDAMGHVNQTLVGIRFAAEAAPEAGTSLLAAEKVAGKLTSIAWSPKLAAPLGLAMVRRGAAAHGTHLSLPDGQGTVVALPPP